MKNRQFDKMSERQQHTVIVVGGILFLLVLAVMLGIIKLSPSVVFFACSIISAVIVLGGILRIVNIIRTPTEEEPDSSLAPAVQAYQDDDQSQKQQTVVVVQQPAEKKTKGRIWGTLGMLYMAGYAMHINSVISGAEVNNLGEAIGKAAAINMFSPFFYIVLAAALLSLVGVIGKNKMCMLLALAATIGAVFILPGAFEILIIPAVLFLISYIRMAK